MAFKFVLFVTSLAYASAGLIGAPTQLAYSAAPAVSHVSYSSPIVSYGSPLAISTPTLTSQSQNILRSYGNLGQISSHSKTIDTPYSSVSKSDVRISNPGITTYAAQPLAYAQPLAHAQPLAYAQPLAQPLAYAAHAQPLAYAQPLLRAQPLAYSQSLAHAQPLAYAQPLAHAQPLAYAQSLGHAQPLAYAQPLAHAQPLAYAQPLAHAPLLTSYAAPHYGSIGSSQQSTLRSLDGNSAVSHQSKAVDSAYSSVRKYDTRITNDAQYAVASPVVSAYAAPLQTYAAAAPVVKSIGYSTAPVVASAHFQGLGVQYAW